MEHKSMDFLDESWLECDEFIIYGFGDKLAALIIDDLLKAVKVVSIIDNDAKKQGNYKGIPIVSSEIFEKNIGCHKIIVALGTVWYPSVATQLASLGLRENKDFCSLKTFLTDYFFGKFHHHSLYIVQSILTSKCTLNCDKCALYIPFYQKEYTCDSKKQKENYDLLFKFIDYVPFISMIGGETFLYPELGTLIEYLEKNYSNRYGRILITTNGMVCPEDPLLQTMKKSKVSVNVSDYTPVLDYEKKLNEVCGLLRKNAIHYSVHTFPNEWLDSGIPGTAPQYTSSSVREHMLSCNPECNGYYDGKLYYCDASWSAEMCGLVSLRPGDWIDLKKLPLCEDSKREIVRFTNGIFKQKEYMSMCAICNGFGADNPLKVQPGLQKPKG